MTLTEAPNDFGGRLRLNCALTTPEFPIMPISGNVRVFEIHIRETNTMRTGHFAPDYSYLCSSDFSMCAIDERNLLTKVEAIILYEVVFISCDCLG